jgi:hypothetical protein
MLLLLGYLGGLLATFVAAVGALIAVQGLLPEKGPNHPRPIIAAQAHEERLVDTPRGTYAWGPEVAPGIPFGETAPSVSQSARLRKAAAATADEPRRHASHVHKEKRPHYARPKQEESPVALGYASEPTFDRGRIW